MNDIVSTAVTARSPALRQIYEVIAAGASARDADRIHPHDALTRLRQARFSALHLPTTEGGGGGTLRDVIEEAIYLAEAGTNLVHIFRNHFTFVERFLVGSTTTDVRPGAEPSSAAASPASPPRNWTGRKPEGHTRYKPN